MKNKKTISIEVTKQQALGLYQAAKEVVKTSFDQFKDTPSGLLIPKHMPDQPVVWHGKTHTVGQPTKLTMADMVKASKELTNAQAKQLAEHMKEAILTGPVIGQSLPKITLDDVAKAADQLISGVVKYSDYQQVPKHIADDAAIAPQANKAKPLDYKHIAAMLTAGEYTQDATGAAHFNDGTVLSNQMLQSPSFTQMLKTATVQLTTEKLAAEKQAKAGGVAPNHSPVEVSESEEFIIKELGLTKEEYLKWINDKPDDTLATIKGAQSKLLSPGLKKSIADTLAKQPPLTTATNTKYVRARLLAGEFEYNFDKNTLTLPNGFQVPIEVIEQANFMTSSDMATFRKHMKKKVPQYLPLAGGGQTAAAPAPKLDTAGKLLKYAKMYGMDPASIAEMLGEPIEVKPQRLGEKDRLKILEAIVSAILLSPRSLNTDDGQFVVPPEILTDLHKTLRLKVVFDPKTNNYIASLE